jgi:ABC-type Fe3+-siderophore transport system permease subunit
VCVFTTEQADALVRPGPRMAEGARLMAQCLSAKAPGAAANGPRHCRAAVSGCALLPARPALELCAAVSSGLGLAGVSVAAGAAGRVCGQHRLGEPADTLLNPAHDADEHAMAQQIVWDIRLPRTLGAWAAGALLGLAGAVAQGLFRNPLADPYLLGSASGASLGVALALAAMGGAGACWVAP